MGSRLTGTWTFQTRALDWSEPVEPSAFYKNLFRPAAGVRLHDLRHTFAALLLSAGAHYMQVSKWLGHESYVTTLTIYADYIPEDEVARPSRSPGRPRPRRTPPPIGGQGHLARGVTA